MKIFVHFIFLCVTIPSVTLNAQWVQIPNGMGTTQDVRSIVENGTNIFAGTYGNGVFGSTDFGDDWTEADTGLTNHTVYVFAINGTRIFAGTLGGVFVSTNNGTSWNSAGLTIVTVSLVIQGANIYAGTPSSGVFLSTNNGVNWSAVNNGLPGTYVSALASIDTNIFAATNGSGVFRSVNNGTNWTAVNNGFAYLYMNALTVIGTNIFAGNGEGLYISTNIGASWTFDGIWNNNVQSLATSGNNIFMGTLAYGIFLSTNFGSNWTDINQGFGTITTIYSLLTTSDYVFAGTLNQSIWRRNLSDILNVPKISESIPSAFSLYQNYPNPFNPSTKIKFSLPRPSEGGVMTAKLIFYDLLGREVATLVNEPLKPGTYEVSFDGSKFATGIYFYKLQAGDPSTSSGKVFVQTRKMILLK